MGEFPRGVFECGAETGYVGGVDGGVLEPRPGGGMGGGVEVYCCGGGEVGAMICMNGRVRVYFT